MEHAAHQSPDSGSRRNLAQRVRARQRRPIRLVVMLDLLLHFPRAATASRILRSRAATNIATEPMSVSSRLDGAFFSSLAPPSACRDTIAHCTAPQSIKACWSGCNSPHRLLLRLLPPRVLRSCNPAVMRLAAGTRQDMTLPIQPTYSPALASAQPPSCRSAGVFTQHIQQRLLLCIGISRVAVDRGADDAFEVAGPGSLPPPHGR